MATRLVAWLTIAGCLLTALIEPILGCTSAAGLSPSDVLIVLFVIGPYFLWHSQLGGQDHVVVRTLRLEVRGVHVGELGAVWYLVESQFG